MTHFIAETELTPQSPCIPSPCGPNAICKEQNGAGSCTCAPDYIGNPYEGCRPECTVNSDCPSNLACIRSKCQNPCPGTCGSNADCTVINHLPSCTCLPGFTGDPFVNCYIQPAVLRKFELKSIWLSIIVIDHKRLERFNEDLTLETLPHHFHLNTPNGECEWLIH